LKILATISGCSDIFFKKHHLVVEMLLQMESVVSQDGTRIINYQRDRVMINRLARLIIIVALVVVIFSIGRTNAP
jgi:hypothetical protein